MSASTQFQTTSPTQFPQSTNHQRLLNSSKSDQKFLIKTCQKLFNFYSIQLYCKSHPQKTHISLSYKTILNRMHSLNMKNRKNTISKFNKKSFFIYLKLHIYCRIKLKFSFWFSFSHEGGIYMNILVQKYRYT